MKDDKIVFCDTGFVIRLLDETNELHNNALGYYKYFHENDYILRMSTIAVAEFCVKDSVEHLPLKNILLAPFNANHAVQSGECARILYDAKAKGVMVVNTTSSHDGCESSRSDQMCAIHCIRHRFKHLHPFHEG